MVPRVRPISTQLTVFIPRWATHPCIIYQVHYIYPWGRLHGWHKEENSGVKVQVSLEYIKHDDKISLRII